MLVVVLALLSALMLLGFLFFTIASQERENARYFTASEKWYNPGLTAEELMDFALEQVIVGPQDDLANSALWGGRFSLLANLVGDDLTPYNGLGVNVADRGKLTNPNGPGDGVPVVDQNGDLVADTGGDGDGDGINDLLALNVGAIPDGATSGNLRTYFAKPDVGYSYSDLNSPFLAYIGTEPMSGKRILIPSFHRPQYLRALFTNPPASPVVPEDQWYTDARTLPYVLRPHALRQARVYNWGTGRIENTGVERFVGGATGPFFQESLPQTSTGTTPLRSNPAEGIWDWDRSVTGTAPNLVDGYDADPDGDASSVTGLNEAVWLDLDHPVEETPDGTQKFIPLFAVTIYDLDGLLNVNAHGNHSGLPQDLASLATPPSSPFQFLSRGNEGRNRSEVNPEYALLDGPDASRMPSGSPDYTQHERFFGAVPTSPTQLGNMEWWFILAGRGELDAGGKPGQIFPGRYGEASLLSDALTAGTSNPYAFPRPGKTGEEETDSTADALRGSVFNDANDQLFPSALIFPAPRHPEDHQGQGTYVGNDGKARLLSTPSLGLGRVVLPVYQNYWLPQGAFAAVPGPYGNYSNGLGPLWAYALGATFPATTRLVGAAATGTGLFFADGRLVDNPGETKLDAELARDQVTDSIFGPEETAALHMSKNDRDSNSIVSRLIKLAPANLDSADDSAARRSRLTTVSSDLKAYTYPDPTNTSRSWERRADLRASTNDIDRSRADVFPPYFGAAGSTRDVFRQEARALLQQTVRTPIRQGTPSVYDSNVLKALIRKLSVNHVAASYLGQDSRPRFHLRPVTPHVRNVATPIVVGSFAPGAAVPYAGGTIPYMAVPDEALAASGISPKAINPATPAGQRLQEWYARRDRQNLARDIYALLYTLGHPNPAANVAVTPNSVTVDAGTGVLGGSGTHYTPAQLVEMAQFSVNLVDAMDPDDTVSCFVFDLDLADGYTPRDDGYVDPVTTVVDWDVAADENGDLNPENDRPHFIDQAQGRGMVYGVEAQKLTISEAMFVFAKRVEEAPGDTPTDHELTEWDDETDHRDFSFVELMNVGPEAVSFNENWQIVLRPSGLTSSATSPPNEAAGPVERHLTLTSTAPPVGFGAGGIYAIAAAGDDHNRVRTSTTEPFDATRPLWSPLPSRMRVNATQARGAAGNFPAQDTLADANWQTIVPPNAAAAGNVRLDLLSPGVGPSYRIFEADPATPLLEDREIQAGAPSEDKAGEWLNLGDANFRDTVVAAQASGDTHVIVQLRRRANLNLPVTDPTDATEAQDNPWVTVDEMAVPLVVFDASDLDSPDFATTVASTIVSEVRREPLSRIPFGSGGSQEPHPTAASPAIASNDFGAYYAYTGAPATFSLWQRHFDRSFGSLADILSVPLYGPSELTLRMSNAAMRADPRETAAVNFLFPDDDPRTSFVGDGDLWYRLFEFIEVPQKHGDSDALPWFAHYGGPSEWLADPARRESWLREGFPVRDFGKLNLNMMRHPHVLAGLLDDPRVAAFMNDRPTFPTPGGGAGFLTASGLTSAGTGNNIERWLLAGPGGRPRDWWHSMIASRDGGYDPYCRQSGIGQLYILPGVPSAKPFRDFGSAPFANSAASIGADFQQTFLRTMPADGDGALPFDTDIVEQGATRRSLFELGNFTTGSTTLGDMNAEFSTRYRLLGKVLNHGTTRSNTYVAFIQVDFFEATPPDGIDHDSDPATAPVYQIGAKMPADSANSDKPRYRGAYVIDRSLALELLKRPHLPPSDIDPEPAGLYPTNSQYRTYSFARQLGSDQQPEPVFPWKKLVLSGQIIAQ